MAGVKAPRVVFAHAADASAAAFRKAVAAGLALLKGGGTVQLAVASAGAAEPDGASAEALVAAVDEATLHLPRHQAQRAAGRQAEARDAARAARPRAAAAEAGLKRGQAIAAGVHLARECANRPGNHCTPTYLAPEAKKLAKAPRVKVEVLDRKDCEKLGMGSFLAVAQGSDEPLKFIVLRYSGARQGRGARGAGRQGHHLRHRRHLAQARRRDGRDEVRHGRCRQRAGHLQGAGRCCSRASTSSA